MGACDASLLGVPFTISHYTDLHAFVVSKILHTYTLAWFVISNIFYTKTAQSTPYH